MPLIGDSKSVYVGTTPITKVMAGDVEVWPKIDPLLTQFKTDLSGIGQGQYVSWGHKFTDCGTMLTRYKCRYGFAANPDGTGAITWQSYFDLGDYDFYFYSPSHESLAWCTPYTLDNEWDGLARYIWYQVLDSTTGKTIVSEHFDRSAPYVPRPADAINCTEVLPIDSNITTYVPGDPQRRIYVAWENILNYNCVEAGALYIRTGVSASADGSTEPISWSTSKRLNTSSHFMLWPTYNSILWSPDEANNANPNLQRLWYWVTAILPTGGADIAKGQIDQYAPFYPYPSGDVVTC